MVMANGHSGGPIKPKVDWAGATISALMGIGMCLLSVKTNIQALTFIGGILFFVAIFKITRPGL